MGAAADRPKGREVHGKGVWCGKCRHAGQPSLTHNIQYRGQCDDEVSAGGGLRATRGQSWDGLGGRRAEYYFYTNHGRIPGRNPEWVQEALAETVAMFLRVVLEISLDKTKDILFMSRLFSEKPGEKAYKQSRNGGGNVPGAENNPGNWRRVWGFGSGLFLEALHGIVPRDQITADDVGRRGRGKTNHIRGLIPHGLDNHRFSGAGIPSGSPQYRETAGKFHALAILGKGGGVSGGEVYYDPL